MPVSTMATQRNTTDPPAVVAKRQTAHEEEWSSSV
jgi:hypothetical protein